MTTQVSGVQTTSTSLGLQVAEKTADIAVSTPTVVLSQSGGAERNFATGVVVVVGAVMVVVGLL